MDAPAAVDEKVCPECAETVKSAALVCRYCGHRFDGKTIEQEASQPPTAAVLTSTGPRTGILIWALASAGLMIIGSFGPWLKALTVSVAGTDGGNDGWVIVVAAVIAAVLVFFTRSLRGAGAWALIGGVIGAAVTIHDRHHVSVALQGSGALARSLVQIGWGLNLAIAASISFALAGLIWLFAVASEGEPRVAVTHGDAAERIGSFVPVQRRNADTGEWFTLYVKEPDATEAPS